MEHGIHITIYDEALTPDAAALMKAERAQLKALGYTHRRRAEWIRGRLAVRRALIAWTEPLQGNPVVHTPQRRRTSSPPGQEGIQGWLIENLADIPKQCDFAEDGLSTTPSCGHPSCSGGEFDVLSAPDGAPFLTGGLDYAVSLSHDGGYVAVALAPGRSRRVGVDLCLRRHTARAQVLLDRLGVVSPPLDPVTQWAALECALKVRRRGVTALLDAALSLERCAEALVVRGLGEPPVVVYPRTHEAFVVCTGAASCPTS